MDKDLAQYSVAFHNRARERFFDLYREFKYSVALIDRQLDENVFQQLHGRYVSRLRQQLQSIAMDILNGADRSMDRNEIHSALTALIEKYSREFIQKVQSL